MRIRDRGIGNMPFIMVLVVMLIALALYFMEADKREGADLALKTARTEIDDIATGYKVRLIKLDDLNGALRKRIGIPGLDTAKSATEIDTIINQALSAQINALSDSSRTKLPAGAYTVTDKLIDKGSAPDKTRARAISATAVWPPIPIENHASSLCRHHPAHRSGFPVRDRLRGRDLSQR